MFYTTQTRALVLWTHGMRIEKHYHLNAVSLPQPSGKARVRDAGPPYPVQLKLISAGEGLAQSQDCSPGFLGLSTERSMWII